MQTRILLGLILATWFLASSVCAKTADEWLDTVDRNMTYKAAEWEARMIIHTPGGREREFGLIGKVEGETRALMEYTDPPRERGVRYLKRDDQLWIYFPRQDRTMLVQGHMLREGVQGGDFSYEDMTESKTLRDKYTASIVKETDSTVVIEMEGKDLSMSYPYRKIFIDKRTGVAMRTILSGVDNQPIKEMQVRELKKIGNRQYPMDTEIRSLLVEDKWTRWIMTDIRFVDSFPDGTFTKQRLEE
ncbi:outer membrane lipoprotein-sorting protein [bacterium]|nr:outer membrane lipoprotein-sorting protein [bacterium]